MSNEGRVVIGGASGFMGTALTQHYVSQGREVIAVGSSGISWQDQNAINEVVNGADLVIGLSGKSVNCRYNSSNRAEIFRSRLDTVKALGEAVVAADDPPPVWINASTATIYRHAEDRPMTEANGEIGAGFSVEVAKAWERELFARELTNTRRVALRTTIVLGNDGVLKPVKALARLGLGGTQFDGRWPISRARRAAGTAHEFMATAGKQRFSWVHIGDLVRMIDFIEMHGEIEGAVNAGSPTPIDNHTFMRAVRKSLGVPFGLPMPRWMQEIGAILIRTETELTLKSRWVLPQKLIDAGFEFDYPEINMALENIFSDKPSR